MSGYLHTFVILFQSTLRRTERQKDLLHRLLILYFNPRSGERSDLLLSNRKFKYGYFNPRSGERSDYYSNIIFDDSVLFQSTLRRTERPCTVTSCCFRLVFQSTLRRTERHYTVTPQPQPLLFQSTLRRTERPFCCAPVWTSTQFQSTLRRTERRT